jgi:hypothetical protein
MASESESTGVGRDEFYSIVALLFFSLFGVVTVLSLEPSREFRIICNMILFITFGGAGAWFMSLSSRARRRASETAPETNSRASS